MKSIFPSLVLIFSSLAPCIAQDNYTAGLQESRELKGKELKSRKHSPLQRQDRKAFQNLSYYPIDSTWKVKAHLEAAETIEEMAMATSAGQSKTFYPYGTLSFRLQEKGYQLTAYKRIYPEGYVAAEEYLFIPFTDLTTGDETYGGGRYMDLSLPLDTNNIYLDFNQAYNPYCAYGSGFSCPIPPRENFLDCPVVAGEKAYAGKEGH